MQVEKPSNSLIKESQSYKIEIKRTLQDKINVLCSKIHNIEWSGILFYKVTGSIQKKNLKIFAIDLLLMDVGKGTTTEYDMTPDVAQYMAENDLLEGVYIGLIH